MYMMIQSSDDCVCGLRACGPTAAHAFMPPHPHPHCHAVLCAPAAESPFVEAPTLPVLLCTFAAAHAFCARRLVEIRTCLEKIRPIDKQMAYQVRCVNALGARRLNGIRTA